MLRRRATATQSTSLLALRRNVESVDKLLQANDARHRASLVLSGEMRRHVDSLAEVGGTDAVRLQSALTRLNDLAERQSAALKKVAETASKTIARLR
ncbi:MAG: hypothetical protein FJX57_19910 [Alphaproteobacteria bacterium]|nr:hypothetical protein [Alphaproteobacteria bacterium]